MNEYHTTTKEIWRRTPTIEDFWEPLMKSLGKKNPDDKPVTIAHIYDTLGLGKALFALARSEGEIKGRIFDLACIRRVLKYYTGDLEFIMTVIKLAEDYCNNPSIPNFEYMNRHYVELINRHAHFKGSEHEKSINSKIEQSLASAISKYPEFRSSLWCRQVIEMVGEDHVTEYKTQCAIFEKLLPRKV